MLDIKNSECLLPKTRKLLFRLITMPEFLSNYVLVGGTGLSLYLCHRKSEDLDFFRYEDAFNKSKIYDVIKIFKNKEIINDTNDQIDVLINNVKVTFFNSKWAFLKPKKISRFNLAPFNLIASMKVHTLFLRAKYRDYYDLYMIVKKKMTIRQLYSNAKNILEGINFKLFCSALIYIDDIEDDNIRHLEPIENISKEAIRDFFEEKIKKEIQL